MCLTSRSIAPSTPQAIQSTCTHLVSLCLSLEHGLGVEALRPLMGDMGKGRRFVPARLEPPGYLVTIVDLIGASAPDASGEAVRWWSRSTSEAWSGHHDHVRGWARAVMDHEPA